MNEPIKGPLVYVAGPYTNGIVAHNIRRAIQTGMDLIDYGFVPFIPHTNHIIDLIVTRGKDFWLNYDLSILSRCDAMLRISGFSPGSDVEVEFCKANDIPFFYRMTDLVGAWKDIKRRTL